MHVRQYRAWLPVVLVAALAGGWSTPALAQAGRISGRVRDATSGEPIKGATIVAEASSAMPGSLPPSRMRRDGSRCWASGEACGC